MGRTRRTTTVWAAIVAATALVLSACGGGDGGGLLGSSGQEVGEQDINAQDPATLRDGGDLRMPLDNIPPNFNYNQLDGNEGQNRQILWAMIPRAFNHGADGTSELNTDYVTSAELTSDEPQVVTYQINPDAVWDSGRPITWEDFEAQWQAMNGENTDFQFNTTTGWENIATVERGGDDKEVLVTFAEPFAEWEALFSPLYPFETNRDPDTFNEGWQQEPLDTAGPFRVQTVDQGAQRIILERNDSWWGEQPRLDRLIFSVLDRNTWADAMANNEIDWYTIGSNIDLFQRASTTPGVEIRQALEKQYPHITFNGAQDAILGDVAVRQAVVKGIDRQGIATALVGQIVPDIDLQGNHIFPFGSAGYEDNGGPFAFDPEAAASELDELGWELQGETRTRDGEPLNLRFVTPAGNPTSDLTARTVLQQLAQIGVQVTIEPVPTADFFDQFLQRGNFDLTSFQWVNTATPFSSSRSTYQEVSGDDIGNNMGSISTPEILALFDEGTGEFDEQRRFEIGNEIDRIVWEQVHHLPLYPQTGAHAVRATVANFGAKGLGDWDYVPVGFVEE